MPLAAPLEIIHDQAFNVGRTSENFQIRDVANLVAEVVPNCEVAFAPGASPDARNYRVDFRKIELACPVTIRSGRSGKGSKKSTKRTDAEP